MDLYHQLADIFEIGTIDIDKANRRTLQKYAVRTKFQKRREAFYSVCKDGKKSKVAICKKEDRPTWVHNLETLKTKQLRKQLGGFLEELGILKDPKAINIKKLAKDKNWHEVLYMQDKKGGMLNASGGSPPQHGFVRNAPGTPAPAAAPAQPASAPRVRIVNPNLGAAAAHNPGPPAGPPPPLGIVEPGHVPPVMAAIVPPMQGQLDNRIEKLEEAQKLQGMNAQFQKLTSMLETKSLLRPPPPLHDPERVPDKPWGAAGGDGVGSRAKDFDIVKVGQDCFFINDDEKCVCKPHKVKFKDMSKQTKRKLKELAEHKQLTCSKIDLLRCLSVEFDTQSKLWGKFNNNCQGDFLATITAETVKELGSKNALFSGPDLHSMKSVAQCYNLSQNLAKGHKDSLARFKDRSAIDQDYTLGHLCYDELLSNVRKFGDDWSKRAYQNRIPDPNPKKLMYCQQEDGVVEIVDVAPQPSTLITTQCPGPSCPSGGGGMGMAGAPGPPGPAGRDGPVPPPIRHPPPPVRIPDPPQPRRPGPDLPWLTFPAHERIGSPFSPPAPRSPPSLGKPWVPQTSRCNQMRVSLATMQYEKRKKWDQHGLTTANLADIEEIMQELIPEIRKDHYQLGRFVDMFWDELQEKPIPPSKFEYLTRICVSFCENKPWVSPFRVESDNLCGKIQEYFQWHQLYCLEEKDWTACATLIEDSGTKDNLETHYPDGSGWARFDKWWHLFKDNFGLPAKTYTKYLNWVMRHCGTKAPKPEKPETPEKPKKPKPKPDEWGWGQDHDCEYMMKLMDDLFVRRISPADLEELFQLIKTYTSQPGQWSPQMLEYTLNGLRAHYDRRINMPESHNFGIKEMLWYACEGGDERGPEDPCRWLAWRLSMAYSIGIPREQWREFYEKLRPYMDNVHDEDAYLVWGNLRIMQQQGRGYPQHDVFQQLLGWVIQACLGDLDAGGKKKKKKKLITWIDDPFVPEFDPEPPDDPDPKKIKTDRDFYCAKFLQDLQMARPGPNNIIPLNEWATLKTRIDIFMEARDVIGEQRHARFMTIIAKMMSGTQTAIQQDNWFDFVNTLTRICNSMETTQQLDTRPDEQCARIQHMLYEANSTIGLSNFSQTGWTELFELLRPIYPKMTPRNAAMVRDMMDRRLGVVRGRRPTADEFASMVDIVVAACRRPVHAEQEEKYPDRGDEKDIEMDQRIVDCAEMLGAFDNLVAGANVDQPNLYNSIMTVIDEDLVGAHRYKHMIAVLEAIRQGGAAPDEIAKCRDTIEFGCRRIGGQTMRPPKNDICEWIDYMLGEANALTLTREEWTELRQVVMIVSQTMERGMRQEVNRAINALSQGRGIPFNHFIQLREQLWTTCTSARRDELLREIGVTFDKKKKPPEKPDKPWKKKKFDHYNYCIQIILAVQTAWHNGLDGPQWAELGRMLQPMQLYLRQDTRDVLEALARGGPRAVTQERYLWARHDIWYTCMGYPRPPDPGRGGGDGGDGGGPAGPPTLDIPDNHPCEWLHDVLMRVDANGSMLTPELRILVQAGLQQMHQIYPDSNYRALAQQIQTGQQTPQWWQALRVQFAEDCREEVEQGGPGTGAPGPAPATGPPFGGPPAQPAPAPGPAPAQPAPGPRPGRQQPGLPGRQRPFLGGGTPAPPPPRPLPPRQPPNWGGARPFQMPGIGGVHGQIPPQQPVNPPVPVIRPPTIAAPAPVVAIFPAIQQPGVQVSREMNLILRASQLLHQVATTGVDNGRGMALKEALTLADAFVQSKTNINQLTPLLQTGAVPTRQLLNRVQRDLTTAWQALLMQAAPMPPDTVPSPTASPKRPAFPKIPPAPAPTPPQYALGGFNPAWATTDQPGPTTDQPGPVSGGTDPAAFGQPQGAADPAPAKPAKPAQPAQPVAAPVAAPAKPAPAQPVAVGVADTGDEKHDQPNLPATTTTPPIAKQPEAHFASVVTHTPDLGTISGAQQTGPTAHEAGAAAGAMRRPYRLLTPEPSMYAVDEFIGAPASDLSSQPWMLEILMFYKELKSAGFSDSEIAVKLEAIGSGRPLDSTDLRDKIMLSSTPAMGTLGVSKILEPDEPSPARAPALLDAARLRHRSLMEERTAIQHNIETLPIMKRNISRQIQRAEDTSTELSQAVNQGRHDLRTALHDTRRTIARSHSQREAYSNYGSILQEQHEANRQNIAREASNIDMLTQLRKRTEPGGGRGPPGRSPRRRRTTAHQEDEWEREEEEEREEERRKTSAAYREGRQARRARRKDLTMRTSMYDDPLGGSWVDPEYEAPEMKRVQESIRTPSERPFGMQPHMPAPLTQEEIDEEQRQEAAELRAGHSSGHELEAGKVASFLSPDEAPVTRMERRAEQLMHVHQELGRPEEGQFIGSAGQAIRAAAPVSQLEDIDWKTKDFKQWKALHRKTERKFDTKMEAFRKAQAVISQWREPIKKVTPEDGLELISALEMTARYKEVTGKNARYLQSFIRPSIKSRFEKLPWKTTAIRGRKISKGAAVKLSQLATSLRGAHNKTQHLVMDDMLPILEAIGESRALTGLYRIRAPAFAKAKALRDETDELALDGQRYEYAMQMRTQHPRKSKGKKRTIKSKVKQMRHRVSPTPSSSDLSPAETEKPAAKRFRGPQGRVQAEEQEQTRFGTPPPKRQNVASGPGPFGARSRRFTERHQRAQQARFYRARAGTSEYER